MWRHRNASLPAPTCCWTRPPRRSGKCSSTQHAQHIHSSSTRKKSTRRCVCVFWQQYLSDRFVFFCLRLAEFVACVVCCPNANKRPIDFIFLYHSNRFFWYFLNIFFCYCLLICVCVGVCRMVPHPLPPTSRLDSFTLPIYITVVMIGGVSIPFLLNFLLNFLLTPIATDHFVYLCFNPFFAQHCLLNIVCSTLFAQYCLLNIVCSTLFAHSCLLKLVLVRVLSLKFLCFLHTLLHPSIHTTIQ